MRHQHPLVANSSPADERPEQHGADGSAQLLGEVEGAIHAATKKAAAEDDFVFQDWEVVDDSWGEAASSALPPDPQLQPWVTTALSPDHLELRLRNIASSMSTPALTALMTQIHDGVDADTWAVVQRRTPDLAALLDHGSGS